MNWHFLFWSPETFGVPVKIFSLLPPVPAPRPSVYRAGAYAVQEPVLGLIRAQKDTRHHAAHSQLCAGQLS